MNNKLLIEAGDVEDQHLLEIVDYDALGTQTAKLYGRRDFLRTLTAGAAAAIVPEIVACKKKKKPNKGAGPESVESSKYDLPKIEFKKVEGYENPDLPNGIDPVKDLPKIREEFAKNLKKYFEDYKKSPDLLFQDVVNYCFDTLINLNPAFRKYLSDNKAKLTSNIQVFITFINKFLLPQKLYLYADFRFGKRVNLYNVKESMDTYIDGKKEAKAHFLGDGIVAEGKFRHTLGDINDYNRNVVHIWPARVREKFIKLAEKVQPNEARTKKLYEDTKKGVKYHEGMHIHLYRKFPNITKRPKFAYITYKLEEGQVLKFSGNFQYNIFHEMAAIGAQLAKAEDPAAILLFLENVSKSYQLARSIMVAATIKHMDAKEPIKQQKLQVIRSAPNNIDFNMEFNALREFFIKNKDLKIIHKIGKDLYKLGYDALEKMNSM